MKKFMVLAVVAIASAAMISCAGEEKEVVVAKACNHECATCPNVNECPDADLTLDPTQLLNAGAEYVNSAMDEAQAAVNAAAALAGSAWSDAEDKAEAMYDAAEAKAEAMYEAAEAKAEAILSQFDLD